MRRVGLRLGDRDCVDCGELVKFTVFYFFGECQGSASVPVMGSVVVVVSEGGCGRYLRDRSSWKDLVCSVSHVNLESFSGWSMRVLWRIIGEIRVRWCVVSLLGGTVLAVAEICGCLVLGLWMPGFNSVVKLLGGRVQSGWCRLDCWWHCVGSCCV